MSAASASVALTAAPTLEPDAVFSTTERDADDPSLNVGALFAGALAAIVMLKVKASVRSYLSVAV